MLVKFTDGRCRDCGGQLEITKADDSTMNVECTECADSYVVEPDAFGDGGIHYWPHVMALQEEESLP
ncbi:MAG: hypothetical protein AAFN70_17075 [Planctomycetota bacterium]